MVPLGGRNKGKGGSRFGRFLKGKGKAITAILVVLVLLVTATAMSISELITMFEESDEDEDQEGSFTEQVLYVRMTSGTPKKKGDPVKGATVTLTSQKGQNNQQAGDNIEMGPTDDNGEAYVVINGNTSLTAPCPKEFDTDGDGIPDKFEAKYSGGNTWYSMAVGPGSAYTSGPDGNTSNYSSRFGFARISASQNHLKDQSSKPAPSDTWHIVGRQMNDSTAAKRFPYHSMVYVQNAQGYSYGTALVEDCGSDIKKNGALLDCWAPYSKYYNPYREGKLSMSQYLKAMGVPCDKTGYPTVNFLKGTVYVLDTSSNGIAKQYESHITANGGQSWPGSAPSTPGKVADEKDQNHWYTVTCTNPDSNWPLKLDYQAAVAATRENPVVVNANPLHNWYYEFWSETITVGAEGTGGSLSGNFSDWNQVYNKNFSASNASGKRKGINPYPNVHTEKSPKNDKCSALPDCTGYVWGILKQHGVTLGSYGGAGQSWLTGAKKDGFQVSTNANAPKVGAVAVFSGHVAVVAAIENPSHCTLIESDYHYKLSQNPPFCRIQTGWKNGDPVGHEFLGYIYTGK